ncbi:MAG: hydroxyacid dehydrogenase [Candidatus Marinimicrobia bacterium]|nr:hydroxyacid dehydrogenase [Candidatus Neomarinimicrobiota bacterium]MCF7830149.1 hydroxyacid dehydrogenase [Candidatus Neomarinimicrobiota bacterium]MCF7882226.1 hydroxyacid dehydrogenase [Candidatus Neomarinimicrobiota bacterium]
MKYDAAFFEVFAEEERLLREYLPEGYSWYFTDDTIQDDGIDELPSAVISTRTQSKFPKDWLQDLEAIFTRSTGYDHVTPLLEKYSHLDSGHLPKYAARAVAEQILMLALMLFRRVDLQRESMQTFARDGLTGRELTGKTLTIIGVGNIGGELANIGYGLGMNLIGVDIVPRGEMIAKYLLEYQNLIPAIQSADIISCCLPLTEQTQGMLDYDALCNAPASALYINAARGEITPPADLVRLLREERLAGAALDVYDEEGTLGSVLRGNTSLEAIEDNAVSDSVEATLKLMEHPRVIATPHNAFNTAESTNRKAKQTAENIGHYLSEGRFLTPVPRE